MQIAQEGCATDAKGVNEMKGYTLLPALAAATLFSFPAHADIVDFEDLVAGAEYNSPLTSGGLTFTNAGDGTGVDSFLTTPYGGFIESANGTTTLIPNFFDSVTTVTAGGSLFTLSSFDWSDPLNFADDPISLVFTFTFGNGTSTTTYFADFIDGMQTETVGLSGLSSFSFYATGSFFAENTIQLDNIVYDLDATGVIPEPATWAMMIGGIGAAGGALRRRKVRTSVTYA